MKTTYSLTYSLLEVMELAVEDARRKKLIPEREEGGVLNVVFQVSPGLVSMESYAVSMSWSKNE